MKFDEFIARACEGRSLSERQIENLEKLIKISKVFHKKAGTYKYIEQIMKDAVNNDLIVIEAAHQPNFLPYSGVWKKVFLLDYIRRKIPNSIPIFGFFDYNLCTSNWLVHNRIPDIKKTGVTTIGFKFRNKDKWKRFNHINKPRKEEWEKEINNIASTYSKVISKDRNAKLNLELIIAELWKSYELGKSLAEVNAIFFARLSNIYFGLKVLFFRYSDLHAAEVLKEEHREILSNVDLFNKIYNEAVIKMGLDDIGTIPENLVPFWYHCACGGKVPISLVSSREIAGSCPVCGTKYELPTEDFDKYYRHISPRAVTRNIVVAEGFGTGLYVSGSGGGLRYGLIANEISKKLGFSLPVTIVWIGRDYYIGPMHRLMLKRLRRIYEIDNKDLLNPEEWLKKIELKRNEIKNKIKNYELQGNNKKVKECIHEYKHSATQIKIAGSVFGLTPSIIDIIISEGPTKLIEGWNCAICDAQVVFEDNFYKIKKDVIYGNDSKQAYEIVELISAVNEKIDPLGILGGA